MLVLSRKIGERIVLPGSGISICVLAISGKRARLGIEAPSSATVHRAEVWQRIRDLTGPGPDPASLADPSCERSAP
ncbi:MAG TPA: carbon storage regulator [Thermoguttaceae bacterium]|nr:carbon storage regulator [Thermoguttaceae bacterium]